ncbi:MAG: ComEA family DNA-binding protein [Ostreibacterium sp.]
MKFFIFLVTSILLFSNSAFAQVNINTASAEQLTALSGIGETRAKIIIQYRKANGKFKSIQDLTNVKGIGESTFNHLKNDVKITGKTDITTLKNKKIKKMTTKSSASKNKIKSKSVIKKSLSKKASNTSPKKKTNAKVNQSGKKIK